MSAEVYANGNAVACKDGDGKVTAAFPDVCNSPPPPPAGPIPVPYPCSSFSSDMKKGSKSVKVGEQPVMLKNQSYFATSPLGNEAATRSFGGSLVTHTITGKTYFAAWSMDVRCEGKNVPRHLDIATSNHGSDLGSTPPFPDLEKLNPADLQVGRCPCCKGTECPAKLEEGETTQTFEEFYGTKTNHKRGDDFAYWKEVKIHKICSCVPPNEVFPKAPCNVFRPPDGKRHARIEDTWNQHSPTYRQRQVPPLKTASDFRPQVLAAAGVTQAQYVKVMNGPKGAEKKAMSRLASGADKMARINHRVPKEAGGCPTGDGNLQPQQTLCEYCQQIDQIMTDTWQGK